MHWFFPFFYIEEKFGPFNKRVKETDINQDEIFQKNCWVHPFWWQKEWWNFGRVESRTSWLETKMISIKLAKTCNKNGRNRMPKIMLNYRPNGQRQFGRPLKRLLDEAERGLSRPQLWQMMMMMMFMMMVMWTMKKYYKASRREGKFYTQ